ncbi:hypothetical protein [Bosea sp. RAC05]|uniref:hypothetical protein n=1 Tax=Bosea sp. RAC05 TaxID=1842539 RepID=UPI0012377DBA|nr:hypothetical protein [Bosea sp. RAC05]
MVKPDKRRISYEGSALSVSLCPEAWSRIARLGGPVREIDGAGQAFLSFHDMDDDARATVIDWAEASGLAERTSVWKAWRWDDEVEAWSFMICPSQAAALAEVSDEDDSDLPPGATALTEPMGIIRLTEAGALRADGYGRDCDATDVATLFWIEDVLREQMPDIIGLWWEERFDPDALSAPRGAIVPSVIGNLRSKVVAGSPYETEFGIEPMGMGPIEHVDYGPNQPSP